MSLQNKQRVIYTTPIKVSERHVSTCLFVLPNVQNARRKLAGSLSYYNFEAMIVTNTVSSLYQFFCVVCCFCLNIYCRQ